MAARSLPEWKDVPLLCVNEIPVPRSLSRCIRILIHWNTDRRQEDIRHVYLRGARRLRPEWAARVPGDGEEGNGTCRAFRAAAMTRTAVVGLGLIGGSAALALGARGYNRDARIRSRARDRGLGARRLARRSRSRGRAAVLLAVTAEETPRSSGRRPPRLRKR